VRLAEFYVDNADELTVDFTGTPLTGVAPTSVTFTSTVTGTPVAYFWDFGDGETSTEEDPVHEYATAGTYPVVCIVEDAVGVQAVKARPAYVTITAA
jgi:PKD repeat protein